MIRRSLFLPLLLLLVACGAAGLPTPPAPDPPADGPTPSFELRTATPNVTLVEVGSAELVLELSTGGGFDAPVDLAVAGLPEGVDAAFSANPVVDTSTLTFTAGSGAAPGSSRLTVTGTAGDLTASLELTLDLVASEDPAPEEPTPEEPTPEEPTPDPDPGNSAPTLAPIDDQTVIRNTLEPNRLELPLDIADAEQARVAVTVDSSNPEVLPGSSFDCELGACLLRARPSADASGETRLTVTVDDGANGVARRSFLLRVAPRLVTRADDAGEGSLRRALEGAAAGDVIGFDLPAGATIALAAPLEIDRPLSVEGPGADALRLSGRNRQRVLLVGDTADVTVSGLSLVDGFATDAGAGVYVRASENVVFRDCAVRGNAVARDDDLDVAGGGVYISEGSSVALEGCRVEGNTIVSARGAKRGGGIFVAPGATLELADSRVASNVAENTSTGVEEGGGVYNAGTLSVTGSTFGGDTAEEGNVATYGGALYASPSSVTRIEESRISSNRARSLGGGVNSAGTVVLHRVELHANTAPHGGGLFNDGDATISDGDIAGNEATDCNGGGISNTSELVLERTRVRDNVARKGDGVTSPVVCTGGGIENAGQLILRAGSRVEGNRSDVLGGGIANYVGATLILDGDVVVRDNDADEGGGIFNGGALLVQGGTIGGETPEDANRARVGGGVVSRRMDDTPADARFVDATVQGNRASLRGGGILSENATLTLERSRIVANRAEHGAGLYLGPGEADIAASSIHRNSGSETAGIHNAAGTLRVRAGTTITANSSNRGAGLFNAEGATATIRDSTIGGAEEGSANRGEAGAGIFNEGALVLAADARVVGNRAAAGGGLYLRRGTVTFSSEARVEGNRAEQGGGIYLGSASLTGASEGPGGNVRNNVPDDIRGANLNLVITGPGDIGDVLITGPNAFQRRLERSHELTDLAEGTYVVTARQLTAVVDGEEVLLRPDRKPELVQQIDLDPGFPGTVEVTYFIYKDPPRGSTSTGR